MKVLAIILSAGVLAGLVVYAALSATESLGMMTGDLMTMRIDTFVGTLASVGFGAAGLALVFRRGFARADEQLVQRHVQQLEQRLAAIEGRPHA